MLFSCIFKRAALQKQDRIADTEAIRKTIFKRLMESAVIRGASEKKGLADKYPKKDMHSKLALLSDYSVSSFIQFVKDQFPELAQTPVVERYLKAISKEDEGFISKLLTLGTVAKRCFLSSACRRHDFEDGASIPVKKLDAKMIKILLHRKEFDLFDTEENLRQQLESFLTDPSLRIGSEATFEQMISSFVEAEVKEPVVTQTYKYSLRDETSKYPSMIAKFDLANESAGSKNSHMAVLGDYHGDQWAPDICAYWAGEIQISYIIDKQTFSAQINCDSSLNWRGQKTEDFLNPENCANAAEAKKRTQMAAKALAERFSEASYSCDVRLVSDTFKSRVS